VPHLVSSIVLYRGPERQTLKKRHWILPVMLRHILKHRNYHSHRWETPKHTMLTTLWIGNSLPSYVLIGDVIERKDSGLMVHW